VSGIMIKIRNKISECYIGNCWDILCWRNREVAIGSYGLNSIRVQLNLFSIWGTEAWQMKVAWLTLPWNIFLCLDLSLTFRFIMLTNECSAVSSPWGRETQINYGSTRPTTASHISLFMLRIPCRQMKQTQIPCLELLNLFFMTANLPFPFRDLCVRLWSLVEQNSLLLVSQSACGAWIRAPMRLITKFQSIITGTYSFQVRHPVSYEDSQVIETECHFQWSIPYRGTHHRHRMKSNHHSTTSMKCNYHYTMKLNPYCSFLRSCRFFSFRKFPNILGNPKVLCC
jgi:hypothetical protein